MDFLYKKELDIINNINAAILYCKNDEFSTILYANQYFYDLIGYTKKEMETIFNNRFITNKGFFLKGRNKRILL